MTHAQPRQLLPGLTCRCRGLHPAVCRCSALESDRRALPALVLEEGGRHKIIVPWSCSIVGASIGDDAANMIACKTYTILMLRLCCVSGLPRYRQTTLPGVWAGVL